MILEVHCRYFRVISSPPSQNVLDDRLKHANSGVVLGTISLFLHLTNDLTDLQEDVYSRIHSETPYCLKTRTPINLKYPIYNSLFNYVWTVNSFMKVLQYSVLTRRAFLLSTPSH